jgi:hypothetical protein
MATCTPDDGLVKALQDIPANGLEYFYSRRLFTSVGGPPSQFNPAEYEVFHGKVGDIDQGYAGAMTYSETNMTREGKFARRGLLREVGWRFGLEGLDADPAAILAIFRNSHTGIKRKGSDYDRLGNPLDYLMGPDLARSLAGEASIAAPPPAFTLHQRGWNTAKCGLHTLSQPLLIERDEVFSLFLTLTAAVPALAGGEVWDWYVKIGMQWVD